MRRRPTNKVLILDLIKKHKTIFLREVEYRIAYWLDKHNIHTLVDKVVKEYVVSQLRLDRLDDEEGIVSDIIKLRAEMVLNRLKDSTELNDEDMEEILQQIKKNQIEDISYHVQRHIEESLLVKRHDLIKKWTEKMYIHRIEQDIVDALNNQLKAYSEILAEDSSSE